MFSTSAYRIPIIYGAGTLGTPSMFGRDLSGKEAQAVIDGISRNGPITIDTSNLYGGGTSEEVIATLDLHGGQVDTKLFPVSAGDHSTQKLKETFKGTLQRLKGAKIRVLYLHAPDRTVPFEETVSTINDLYKEGHFEEFGLSNYLSYEVAEIVSICKAKGYVVPTVYQGVYNAVDRTIETELIPCLRRYGLKFAAYCPLAGGFLVGLHLDENSTAVENSHFGKNAPFGWYFDERYMGMVGPVRELRDIAGNHELTIHQASSRWLQHHSALIPSDLGIIYGASKLHHIEPLLQYNSEGPLPEEVVQAFEECYQKVKGTLPNYNQSPAWYDPKIHGY
ncbi:hypothetical protein M422DRAFT_65672 [Sphaerobolus stellatus SS14]|nr:hypothetical protein M422DRAFT_65672 [Sphaerobolus stellatus SS14]